jgi:hypothetical protein
MEMLLPAVALLLGRYLYEGIQVLTTIIDKKVPVAVHGVVLVVVNWGLMQLGGLLGMPLPEALSGFTPEIATSLALALTQMGWHYAAGKGQPKATPE